MKYLSLLLFMMTVFVANGQTFPSEVWHEGKLVTIDEDTLRGKIKYDLENDLIQIESNQNLYTFASRKIFYFEIFDELYENYRHFYAIPYETSANYKVPILFELLYEGNLSLLCREYIATENIPTYNPYGGRSNFSTFKLAYRYYFLHADGTITEFYLKKKELLEIMRSKSSQIKQFIRNNNLDVDKRGDLVRITAYYNSLLDA